MSMDARLLVTLIKNFLSIDHLEFVFHLLLVRAVMQICSLSNSMRIFDNSIWRHFIPQGAPNRTELLLLLLQLLLVIFSIVSSVVNITMMFYGGC